MPPVGGHADLQSVQEVLVGVVGFFVTLLELLFLGSEALALVDGGVELGESVAELVAVDEELEAFHVVGVGGLFLGGKALYYNVFRRNWRKFWRKLA